MKAKQSKTPRALATGTKLTCADNTGARVVQIVSVFGYHGVRRRQPKMGLGDIATVTVKKGTPDMRKKLVRAVVIRQKKRCAAPMASASPLTTTRSLLSMKRTSQKEPRSRDRSPVKWQSGTRSSAPWRQSLCEVAGHGQN